MAAPTTRTLQPSPEDLIARMESSCQIQRTSCGDGEMVWRVWGRGPTLVLLHGSYGSWMHWIRNIEALSRHFRVIAADMPGFGDSALPADPRSCVCIVETIARGIDRLTASDEPISIAGFSYGASMSSPVALASKRGTDAVCLVGSHGLGGKRGDPGPLTHWHNAKTPEELRLAQRQNLAALLIADPANIDELAIHIQTVNTRKTRLRSREVTDRPKLNGSLERVNARVVSIWGSLDATAYPYVAECERRLLEARPDAQMRLLEGIGHWVCYEAAEAFTPLMIEMLGAEAP